MKLPKYFYAEIKKMANFFYPGTASLVNTNFYKIPRRSKT
jgi:hypothetical protein